MDLHNEGLRLSESHAGGCGFISPWNVVEAAYRLGNVTAVLTGTPISSFVLGDKVEEGTRIKEGGNHGTM